MNKEELINSYNENSITALDNRMSVRIRPAMYIGDTGLNGVTTCVREIVDNGGEMWVCDDAGIAKAQAGDVLVDGNSTVSASQMGKFISSHHAMIYIGNSEICHASKPAAPPNSIRRQSIDYYKNKNQSYIVDKLNPKTKAVLVSKNKNIFPYIPNRLKRVCDYGNLESRILKECSEHTKLSAHKKMKLSIDITEDILANSQYTKFNKKNMLIENLGYKKHTLAKPRFIFGNSKKHSSILYGLPENGSYENREINIMYFIDPNILKNIVRKNGYDPLLDNYKLIKNRDNYIVKLENKTYDTLNLKPNAIYTLSGVNDCIVERFDVTNLNKGDKCYFVVSSDVASLRLKNNTQGVYLQNEEVVLNKFNKSNNKLIEFVCVDLQPTFCLLNHSDLSEFHDNSKTLFSEELIDNTTSIKATFIKRNKIVQGKEITIVIASLAPSNATFEQTKKEQIWTVPTTGEKYIVK